MSKAHFVLNSQTLVGVLPPSLTARAHHRSTLLRTRTTAQIALVVLSGLALAGCSAPAETGEDGEPVVAELDRATGTITLPFDRYSADVEDGNLFRVAQAAATAVCAREQGVDFVAPRYVEQDIYRSEQFLGPWTMAQAEKFGFVAPAPDADLRANGFVPADYGEPSRLNNAEVVEANARLTEADLAVIEECGAEAAPFVLPPEGPWFEELAALPEGELAPDSPAVKAVLDALYDCYESEGIGVHASVVGWPEGADGSVIDEEQIRLAVTAVECKERLGTTQELADLWAAAESSILAEYEDEVTARGRQIQQARDEARQYIADHPEVFEISSS